MSKRKVEVIDCDFCDRTNIKPFEGLNVVMRPKEGTQLHCEAVLSGYTEGSRVATQDICLECAFNAIKAVCEEADFKRLGGTHG